MSMCEGVNGQLCPWEKSGFEVVIGGRELLLCRGCLVNEREIISEYVDDEDVDSMRISTNENLTVTPARSLGVSGATPAVDGSQPLFDSQPDVEVDLPDSINDADVGDINSSSDLGNGPHAECGASDIPGTGASVIVNELLCYCFNMISCMAQSMLQKVCADFYDEAVIEAAKDEILIHSVNDS